MRLAFWKQPKEQAKRVMKSLDLSSALSAMFGAQGKLSNSDMMKHSWTYACIDRIASDLANVPLRVEINGKEVPNSPLAKLLLTPNPGASLDSMLYELGAAISIYGKAYVQKSEDRRALWILDPAQVQEKVENSIVTFYRVNNKLVPAELIIRIARQSAMGIMPAPLEAARDAIELDLAAVKYNRLWFEQGGTAGGILGFEGDEFPAKDEQTLRTWLKERASGLENAHKILPMLAKATYTSLSDGGGKQDAAFTEMRRMLKGEVCAALHVPGAMIDTQGEASTYNNLSTMRKQYVDSTLEPIANLICADLTRGLQDFFPGQTIVVDQSQWQLKRELLLDRAAQVQLLAGGPLIMPTEGRELIGFPEIPELTDTQPEAEPPAKRLAVVRKSLDREGHWLKFLSKQNPLEKQMQGDVEKRLRELLDWGLQHPMAEEPDFALVADFEATCNRHIEVTWSGGYESGMGKAMTDPRVMEHILHRKQVLRTAPTHYQQQIRNQLALLTSEGRTLDEAARLVRPLLTNQLPYQAERIARTEVVSAYNAGSLASYGDAGVERKEWLTSIDEKTREGHADADGQVVNINEGFFVDGEELEHPGDPAGSAGNIINCRCTLLPVV